MLNAKLIAIEVIKEYCKGFMFYDFVFCLHSFAGRFETCLTPLCVCPIFLRAGLKPAPTIMYMIL